MAERPVVNRMGVGSTPTDPATSSYSRRCRTDGKYTRLSSGQHGFDSRHRYASQGTSNRIRSVLAPRSPHPLRRGFRELARSAVRAGHRDGSYPYARGFNSLDCDHLRPTVKALHAKKQLVRLQHARPLPSVRRRNGTPLRRKQKLQWLSHSGAEKFSLCYTPRCLW